MRINVSSETILRKTASLLKNKEDAELYVKSLQNIGELTRQVLLNAVKSNREAFNEASFKESIASGMIRVIHMHCATSDWKEAEHVLKTLSGNTEKTEASNHPLALAKEIINSLGVEAMEYKVSLKNFTQKALKRLKNNPNEKPLDFMLTELRETLGSVVTTNSIPMGNKEDNKINDAQNIKVSTKRPKL